MSEQDNAGIVRQAFDAWNAHDPKRLASLLDEELVMESDTLPAPVRGREAQRQFMEMYLHAFPDIHFEVEQMLATGDHVVTRWHATGTHRGELMGIPATNRRGEGLHGCSVIQLKNDRIAREWIYWDGATLLRQLGVLPSPAHAAAR